MKKLCGSLILILALMALVCSVNANTISFTTSLFEVGGGGNWDFSLITGNNNLNWYQPTFLGYGDPADNPAYAINLTQFKPSLGTLNKVTLSLSRAVDASASYQKTGSSSSTYQYYLANQARWVMSGNTLGDFTFAFTNYPDATAVNDTNKHTGFKSQTANSPINQFSNGFNPFIGNGTFATELYEATAVGAVFGNGSFGSTFQVTADVTVSYDYTPVPLTPPVLLLGTGLLGLALLKGRKLFKA